MLSFDEICLTNSSLISASRSFLIRERYTNGSLVLSVLEQQRKSPSRQEIKRPEEFIIEFIENIRFFGRTFRNYYCRDSIRSTCFVGVQIRVDISKYRRF